jgi:hypothetical protein
MLVAAEVGAIDATVITVATRLTVEWCGTNMARNETQILNFTTEISLADVLMMDGDSTMEMVAERLAPKVKVVV